MELIEEYEVVLLVAITVSTLLWIGALVAWCLLPRWRSLQNYIAMNQIACGIIHLTLHLIDIDGLWFYENTGSYIDIVDPTSSMYIVFFLIITLCWSLCGSLVAYLKLVLVYAGQVGAEKRKVTALAYGLLGLIELVIAIVDEYNVYVNRNVVTRKVILIVMSLNLGLFVCMSASARRRARDPPGFALVAASLLFDSTALLYLLTPYIGQSLRNGWLVEAGLYTFYMRLIPQAAVLLLNRRSREQWSSYLARRRARVI